MTASQAKNAIKRCLFELVNPTPKNFDKMWEHFDDRCAYCETKLERHGRQAHKDHLVAFQDSSRKGIGNFVLSCGSCNGDKKREAGWLDYLTNEYGGHERFESRKARIEAWIAKHSQADSALDQDVVREVNVSAALVNVCLDKAVQKLRRRVPTLTSESSNDVEISEEESKLIDLMTAQADEEIFARRKKVRVEFEWDDFSVDVIEKAAALEGLSFEEFLKRTSYYSALHMLK
jgi:hypothetical protein